MSSNFELEGGEELPMFQSSGFVNETGLTIVSEDASIMPAPSWEAEIGADHRTGQGVVNYYFPVEIVVLENIPEEERASIEARIWESLGDALQRMT